jgi:hypothetical protein
MVVSGYDLSYIGVRIMDLYYGWQYPTYSQLCSSYRGSGTWVDGVNF